MEYKITFKFTNNNYLQGTFSEDNTEKVKQRMTQLSPSLEVNIDGEIFSIIKANLMYVTYKEII